MNTGARCGLRPRCRQALVEMACWQIGAKRYDLVCYQGIRGVVVSCKQPLAWQLSDRHERAAGTRVTVRVHTYAKVQRVSDRSHGSATTVSAG